jgi:hypothetical protein
MTQEKFNDVVIRQMDFCTSLLMTKGTEYAPDALINHEIDRLAHFKKAAALMNTTSRAALFSMLAKHLVSISDMCMDEKNHPVEKWDEKITDSINYLFILRAIIEEDMNEKH